MYFSNAAQAYTFLSDKTAYNAHVSAVAAIKNELGVKNFKALASSYRHTQSAQKEALKAVKGGKKCTQSRFVELCKEYSSLLEYRKNIQAAKHARAYTSSNTPRKNCTVFAWNAHYSSQKMDNKKVRDMAINQGRCGTEAMKAKRLDIIRGIISREVVPSVSGSESITVSLVTDPALVSYNSRTDKGDQYSKRCTFRKTDLYVHVKLPAQWYSRVYKRDLYEIDGLFNLDVSTALHGNYGEGVEVFAATWLVDSRGTSKNVVRGFIARRGIYAFHGKTLASAVQGLARKCEIQSLIQSEPSDIIERAKKVDGVLHLSDSYAVGNCEWGTLDFCARHNIAVTGENPSITVKELAQKVALEPRREALAVLVRAIKKHI